MRAIGYVRVSTEEQAREGVSLDAQRGRIIAHCVAQGLDLHPAEIFVDAGISGKRSANRPGFQRAMEAACAGRCALVVYSLSRFARSTRETLELAEQLESAGADLVSLTESIDTTSATGKMVFRLLAVLAEFERDLIIQRTREGIRHKKSKGERIGKIPLGKRISADGRTLEPDPDELAILERIRELADQLGPRPIAARLSAEGFRSRTGKAINESTVRQILKRPGS